MATALDPPAAAPTEKPPPQGESPAPDEEPREAARRACANCGAPLKDGQDWCLQCGASTPGALASGTPSWKSGALVLGSTALLVLGAAAAAYAAWGKGSERPPVHHAVLTIAKVPPPFATIPPKTAPPKVPITPATPTPTTAAKPTPSTPSTPPAPSTPVSPPKIPLTASTPKSSSSSKSTSTSTSPKTTSTPTSTSSEEPSSITLDTNAASTYNPYHYPASNFGDPSLAIDGEPSTAWTAQVNPGVAPRMAVGLLIDLNSPQKVSSLTLQTSTPGMTVQVYGANGSAAPASITDSAWSRLSPSEEVKSSPATIKLSNTTTGFRCVTLGISKAPASSTPAAPGHVSVNEIELFPAS
jgi:hypothetical protein